MKFALKFKLPKWERPKPEVPYVSNPLIGELETIDFASLTAERRRDVLARIKHAATAVASERRRNPAILTDRIRLQRLWVDYFRISQSVPPGEDKGDRLSFAHEAMNASLDHGPRAPGALMTTQEELLAQASFKIDMGDMTPDSMDDFDTPLPRLPPRPLPVAASASHDFSVTTGPVHVVDHPEYDDGLKIAGLHDLVIEPPEASVAALSSVAAGQSSYGNSVDQIEANNKASTEAATTKASNPDEEPPLDAKAQAEIVARMRALAQAEAAAGDDTATASLPENPMVARMRALASAKAAEAAKTKEAEPVPEQTEAADQSLTLDLSALEVSAVETETLEISVEAPQQKEASAPAQSAAPAQTDEEPPRLSAEEQIRLAEEMRARIKAETGPAPEAASLPEDGMVARMRKMAQSKPVEPVTPTLTISIPDDPVEAEADSAAAKDESFETIKSQIVAQTMQQAQSEHLQSSKQTSEERSADTQVPQIEEGMLERLRRLAGLGGAGLESKKAEAETEIAAEPAPEPVKQDVAKQQAAKPAPVKQPDPLPLFEQETAAKPEVAPAPPIPPAPEAPPPAPARPREREASATPSTRDWVNVKLLRPTVIRGLPLPDQVITIVPYPDAKRLEENGSVQILTKPRAPRP